MSVPGATVTLNGVGLPKNERGGFTTYDVPGLNIGVGTKVDLVAAMGASHTAYTFDCPDVVMTAPADGDTVRLGDPVVASWTGLVTSYEGSIDTPMVSLVNYDSTTGRFGYSDKIVRKLDGSTQTANLVTPSAIDTGYDGLAVVLLVPGKPAVDEKQLAIEPYCDLTRRVILKVAR